VITDETSGEPPASGYIFGCKAGFRNIILPEATISFRIYNSQRQIKTKNRGIQLGLQRIYLFLI